MEERFGIPIESESGLRSRIAEARKLSVYHPDNGVSVPTSETWGDGIAPLLPKTTSETFEVFVSLSDIHVPYHDAEVLKAAIDLIRNLQPHFVVINGDTNDFFQLSRFNKSLERLEMLQSDLDQGFDIRKMVRSAAPNAIMRENLGNHDERLITYMEVNAPSVKSLRALKPENLLGLKELEISHFGRQGFRVREDYVIEHGHIARKESGASAKTRADDTLISGLMGHVHRISAYHKTGYRSLSWHEQGCLCQKDTDYIIGTSNWQQGIAIGMFHTKKDNIRNVQIVPAVGKGFIFDGKIYGNVEEDISVEEKL